MRWVFCSLLSLVALAPATVSAQTQSPESKLEISPLLGVRTAGSFRGEEQLSTFGVGSAPTFGTFFNYKLTKQAAAEVLFSHQSSSVKKKTASLSGDEIPDEDVFDIGVTYLHGGIRYGGGNDTYEPYVSAGLGLARFGPSGGDTINKFSFSIGAGLIADINERIAFRAEARAFGTRAGDRQEDLSCGVFGCVSFERASTFWQSHFVGAVVIRF